MKVRKGVSTSVIAAAIVVVIIIIAAGAYYVVTNTAGTTSTTTTPPPTSSSSSSSSSSSASSSASSSGSALDPAGVLSCANQEGSVSVYGLVDTSDWNTVIAPAWSATYPNIKMSYLGLDSGTQLSKMLAEHKAGSVQSDVVESTAGVIYAANQAGALVTWSNPMEAQMKYPAGTFDPQNVWHPYNLYITTPAYNTKLISASALPKTWTQLFTDSAFAGKFAFSNPTEYATGAGIMWSYRANASSYSAWISFMKQVKAQNDVLTPDDGGAATQVVNGQVAIGQVGTNDILLAEQSNATIKPLFLNPIFIQTTPIAISQGAPHPCAAKLLTEWLTAMPGQIALGKTGRTPALPTAAAQVTGLLPLPSNATFYNVDQGQFLSNTTGLSSVFSQIFGS